MGSGSPVTPASVAAYHQNLSAHLISLIRTTTSTTCPPALPSRTSSDPSASTCASSASLSKVSSATSPDQPLESVQDKLEDGEGQFTARPQSHSQELSFLPSSRSSEPVAITPPDLILNLPVTREEEHQSAWRSEGAKIYKSIPEGFNLVLDSAKPRRLSSENKGHGLGINLAVTSSQDVALRMGLLTSQPLSLSPPPAANHNARKVASQDNISMASTAASAKGVSVSSIAKSNQPTPRPNEPNASTSSQRLDTMQEERDDAYESRRLMKLRKKEADLTKKIMRWIAAVDPIDTRVPEIDPTPPTPSITSSRLRISPFQPAMETFSTITSDQTGRLRAIDTLLGDMSLRQTTAAPRQVKPKPLTPNQPLVDLFDLDSSAGGVLTKPAEEIAALSSA